MTLYREDSPGETYNIANFPHPLGPFLKTDKRKFNRKLGIFEFCDSKKRVGERLAQILSAKEWRGFDARLVYLWKQETNYPYLLREMVRITKGRAEILAKVPVGVTDNDYLKAVMALVTGKAKAHAKEPK